MSEPERAADPLRELARIGHAVTYATSIDDLLALLAREAAELLGAGKALVLLADAEGVLHVRGAHGVDAALVRQHGAAIGDDMVERLQALFEYADGASFLGVPLVVRGDVTGILAVACGSGMPSEDDERLLSSLADLAAAPIEVARLDEQIRRGFAAVKERSLAMLAHDLRSPLQAIQGFAEMVEEEVLGPITSQQRHALGRIRMSGRHILAMQESMLAFAHLRGDGAAATAAATAAGRGQAADVSATCDEALALIRGEGKVMRHELLLEPAPDLRARVDADVLRRVLVNIVGNAIKYTPDGGRVTVTVSRGVRDDAPHVVVAVSDSGPGIAAEHLARIFDPYFRVHDRSAPVTPGLGLGLAISREMLQRAGGEVTVESTLGVGSTFRVWLPAAEDAPKGG